MEPNDFILHPPEGTSFALPEISPHRLLQETILTQIRSLSWNRYLTVPHELIRESPWDFTNENALTVFARGSEQAMLEFVRASSARCMIVPEHSYPGYMRVCRTTGIQLRIYRDSDELQTVVSRTAEVDTIIVITEPGNPIDIEVRLALPIRHNPRLHFLVDAAYQIPYGDRFREFVTSWIHRGAAVSFTFSKMASMAGVRLGGIIVPTGMKSAPIQDQRFWDVFSVALISAFCDPQIVSSALKENRRQERLGAALASLFASAGVPIAGLGGGCFVTVPANRLSLGLETLLSCKRFENSWTRVDSNMRNLRLVRSFLSGKV